MTTSGVDFSTQTVSVSSTSVGSGAISQQQQQQTDEEPLSLPYEIVCDYINWRIEKEGRVWRERPVELDYTTPSQYSQVMRSLGEEFERRYTDVFEDMCDRLQITPSSAYATFVGVCQELFREGIRWGRIVALFTFAGALAMECQRKQIPQLVGCVADWAATYVETHLEVWIAQNGGWVGVCCGYVVCLIFQFFFSLQDGFVNFYRNRPPVEGGNTQTGFRRFLTNVGVACGALGVVTLGAILAGRS